MVLPTWSQFLVIHPGRAGITGVVAVMLALAEAQGSKQVYRSRLSTPRSVTEYSRRRIPNDVSLHDRVDFDVSRPRAWRPGHCDRFGAMAFSCNRYAAITVDVAAGNGTFNWAEKGRAANVH